MTRINCILPAELTDAHLGAEYRELPRVFALAHAAYLRGFDLQNKRVPTQYTLGPGHVLFFYSRLAWCAQRYRDLVAECTFRQRLVSYPMPPEQLLASLPAEWKQHWQPTEADKALNRARILVRLQNGTK